MRKHDEPYRLGNVVAYNEEPKKYDIPHFTEITPVGYGKENGFRTGEIGHPVREGEDVGSVEDQSDEQIREKAIQDFGNNVKNIVSAKLMGKKINLKLHGHKDIVAQIANLIKAETDYLSALMSGQAADTPALQKNKAIIDGEAKKLDRMFGVDGLWPFK